MGKPKAPKPPDPKATAAAQTGTNISTAAANAFLNNVNQVGPDGSISYRQIGSQSITDPSTGTSYQILQFEQRTELSPDGRRINRVGNETQLGLARLARGQTNRISDVLGRNVSFDGLPAAGAPAALQGGAINDGSGLGAGRGIWGGKGLKPDRGIADSYGDEGGYAEQRGRVEEALMSRLNPSLERDRENLRTQLSNQGIKLGSDAFDRGMEDFGRQSNDARMAAILGAGQEQNRLADLDRSRAQFGNDAAGQRFGQSLAKQQAVNSAQAQRFGQRTAQAGFGNAAQAQAFGQDQARFGAQNDARAMAANETMALRNQPINEISALMSGSQVSQPQFGATQRNPIATTDYAGLVNQNFANQMGIYGQQMGAHQGMMGSLFGLGGNIGAASILASDRRVKDDVRRIGKTDDGQPLYSYRYKGGLDDGKKHIGLMAQDVQKRKPDAVVNMGGILGVDYDKALS